MPSNCQCSKCIEGNAASFHQQRISQGQTRLYIVELSWIIMLIPQSQEPMAVYCSILENSVIYHHIVTTMNLSKAYQQ